MKKIFMQINHNRVYLVGYSTSLLSYLNSINAENIDKTNALYGMTNDTNTSIVYHTGHKREVTYYTSDIVENEKCFVRWTE